MSHNFTVGFISGITVANMSLFHLFIGVILGCVLTNYASPMMKNIDFDPEQINLIVLDYLKKIKTVFVNS